MVIEVLRLGPQIKRWREKNRITQVDLAKVARCSSGTISLIEHGKADMRVSTYNHLSEIVLMEFRLKYWDYEKEKPFVFCQGWFDQDLFLDVGQLVFPYYSFWGDAEKIYLMRKPRDYGYMVVNGPRCGAIRATVMDIDCQMKPDK